MDIFQRAKVFRLKCGHHSKYLSADPDEETVKQTRDSSSKAARWAIEPVEWRPNVVRLRSCHSWKYLAATDEPFLLGMTGKRVAQRLRLGPTVEWEPIKDESGPYIKLRCCHTGSYLRANRGPPPWRNSVTHDPPGHWTGTENMVLWIVDIVEIDYDQSTRSTVEIERTTVRSWSGNVGNQSKSGSSHSCYVSVEDGGSAADVGSSMEHSNSFSKLKSMLSSLEDILDDTKEGEVTKSDTSQHIHPLEVEMAKQTIKALKDMDFDTILSSGRYEKLEKAINVLILDAKTPENHLLDKLKAMKKDHGSASEDLVACNSTTLSTKRSEMKAELKKDAARARELEALGARLSNTLETAIATREELLRQLEEVEISIKTAEKAQGDNLVIIEELIASLGHKSQMLMEMEKEEKSWQVRKSEAERRLERVEEDWVKIKNMFPNFW